MEGRECRAGNIGKRAGLGWWYSKKRKTNGCGTGSWKAGSGVKRSDTADLFWRL